MNAIYNCPHSLKWTETKHEKHKSPWEMKRCLAACTQSSHIPFCKTPVISWW